MSTPLTINERRWRYVGWFAVGVVVGAVVATATVVPPLIQRQSSPSSISQTPTSVILSEAKDLRNRNLDGIVLVKNFYNSREQTVAVRGMFGTEERALFSIEGLTAIRDATTRRDFIDKGLVGCPHYSGACFSEVSVSPDRSKVIFGNSCLPGSCAIPWTAVYEVRTATTTFISSGAGERFLWNQDNSAVGYVTPIEGLGGETVIMAVLNPSLKIVEIKHTQEFDIVSFVQLFWKEDGSLSVYAEAGNAIDTKTEKFTYTLKPNGDVNRYNGWSPML